MDQLQFDISDPPEPAELGLAWIEASIEQSAAETRMSQSFSAAAILVMLGLGVWAVSLDPLAEWTASLDSTVAWIGSITWILSQIALALGGWFWVALPIAVELASRRWLATQTLDNLRELDTDQCELLRELLSKSDDVAEYVNRIAATGRLPVMGELEVAQRAAVAEARSVAKERLFEAIRTNRLVLTDAVRPQAP